MKYVLTILIIIMIRLKILQIKININKIITTIKNLFLTKIFISFILVYNRNIPN